MSNPGMWILSIFALVLIGSMLGSMILRLRCAHGWDLVDKTEFPAPLETYLRCGGTKLTFGYLSNSTIEDMSKKKVVIVLRCNKCGAARIQEFKG